MLVSYHHLTIQVVPRMPKLYEALAEAFLAEGVDTQFVLMGDGNMHWSTAFAKLPGVHTVHVRHEHSTVAAATAYNVATGKVAVASVTCGPGVTQLMTALPAAVRARLPMVVFAGEPPINAKFYNQYIDQAPLVTATGAHYIAAHSVPRMMDYLREAFHIAKHERRPAVLGIPYDLQKVEHMANQPYETSAMYQPKVGRTHPDPEVVAEAVERLAAAKRPIVLGGRGVLWSGARDAVIKLADRCGALLSNTLPARGLFHDHPFRLGTPGSYFTPLGRGVDESADVVLAVGTSLSYYVGGGHQAYFNPQMRGRPAERCTAVREFGAVGNGLSYARGVAAARRQGREGKIVLFEGDGGLLFHIQELETLKRQGFRILICAMNDGGYGSEVYKLRAHGLDDSLAGFGRPAPQKNARGLDPPRPPETERAGIPHTVA